MPWIIAVGIYRLHSSGSLNTLAEYTRENDMAANLFDALNVRQMLVQRAHLHFSNKDYFQLEKYYCYFSVLVNETRTLLFACIAEPAVTLNFVDLFLDRFQAAVMEDKLMDPNLRVTEENRRKDLSNRIARLLMDQGNQEAGVDRLAEVRQQVEDVKTVMSSNVQRVLERGERLENIEGRTEALTQSSQNFKFTARRVQRRMCLRNAKWTIIIAICATIVVVIIILIILNDAGVFNPK